LLGIVVGALPLALLYFTTPNGEVTSANNISVVNLDSPKVETIATR